jgi:osmoprotectant transport system permease protein
MKFLFKIFLLSMPLFSFPAQDIKIGSKKFTENVLLGELATQLARSQSENVRHLKELGGTVVLWNALLNGDIDLYPEYTGTLRYEILAGESFSNNEDLRNYLKELKIEMSKPLGFNNTYILGMRKERAEELNIKKISDLQNNPELVFGFSNEFIDRNDGWLGLRERYNLPQTDVKGLDHDLAYRGISSGSIDVIDLYATDAEIEYYDLFTLQDDYKYFPDYKAVYLYRRDLLEKNPQAVKSILELENSLNETIMIKLNGLVKLKGMSDGQVASDFISKRFSIDASYSEITFIDRLYENTRDHLSLVLISLSCAIILAIPLGVIANKRKRVGRLILGITGIIQTIPSLALLVFMIPLLGIGSWPAIVALFLYSLLPIVRNTYSGLEDIQGHIKDSAEVLGLPAFAQLKLIELPIASRSILAGIKTSAVINVGTATLGALIGAGGYGQPILTGIRLDSPSLILEGAVPAAILALLAQGFFDILEKYAVPKGLRIKSS